jgi:ABC-type multidrug transport system ATPase subunit
MRFRALLASLGENRIVILCTHILDDVAQTCPRVAAIDRGRLVYDGTGARCRTSRNWCPQSPACDAASAATSTTTVSRALTIGVLLPRRRRTPRRPHCP